MGELVVHMLHVFDFELAVARRDPLDPVFSVEDLGRFTQGYVDAEPERDPRAIADRVEKAASAFLDETAGAAPDDLYDWLGGARLPASVMHAHILSESQVHGWDVARRQRLPWPMRADDAVAALDRESTSATRCGSAAPRPAISSSTTGTWPSPSPEAGRSTATCGPTRSPSTLIAWGRMSPWPSVARGRLRAWGRKPWLAAKLTSLLSTP